MPPSRTPGDSHRCQPSHPATSSGVVSSHASGPTSRPVSHARYPSQANNPRVLTPPPTPAVSRRPPAPTTNVSHEDLTPLPHNTASSHEETEVPEYRPVSVSGLTSHQHTLVYLLLREERMLEYFGMEYGVSKRPPEGKPYSLIPMISLLM